MKKRENLIAHCALVFVVLAASTAGAGVIEFENKDEWLAPSVLL